MESKVCWKEVFQQAGLEHNQVNTSCIAVIDAWLSEQWAPLTDYVSIPAVMWSKVVMGDSPEKKTIRFDSVQPISLHF